MRHTDSVENDVANRIAGIGYIDIEIVEEQCIAAAGCRAESNAVALATVVDADIVGSVSVVARQIEVESIENHKDRVLPYAHLQSIGSIVGIAGSIEVNFEAIDGVDSGKGEDFGLAGGAFHLVVDVAAMGIGGVIVARGESATATGSCHDSRPAVGSVAGSIALEIFGERQRTAAHHRTIGAGSSVGVGDSDTGADATHADIVERVGEESGDGIGCGGGIGHSHSPGGVVGKFVFHSPGRLAEARHPVDGDAGGCNRTDGDTGRHTVGISTRGNKHHVGSG